MLPPISQSRDHPYSKSLSQTMTVGAHRRASLKIDFLRSMASMINTARWQQHPDSHWWHPGGRRRHLRSRQWHLVAGGYTLTVASGTQMVDGSTLMVGASTQTSDDQHRLSNAVVARLGRIVTRPNNTLTFASTRQISNLACRA
jgi:hypothetical protein